MYLDRILYPVTALGPNKRLVLWVAGCTRHCRGCANPELWTRHAYQHISPGRLAECVQKMVHGEIGGITITGGEPFDQAEELREFLDALPEKYETLVFSGYCLEELERRPEMQGLLERVDVLVDGEYIDALNDNLSPLRGSVNQRIHYLNPSVQSAYEAYLDKGRQIQNFVYDYETLSAGIHNHG